MPSELRQIRDAQRRQRTRQALLDAAGQAFCENGFHRTLISDIVARAHVGQGTFYRHFDSKQAVFEALFHRLLEQLLAEFQPMSSRLPADGPQYLAASRAVVGRLAAVVLANRELAQLFLREGRSVGPDFERLMNDTFERFAGLARFYLEHAIRNGFARPCRSELVAEALLGIGLRMLDLWASGRLPEEDLDSLSGELVDFAFLGFGNSKGVDHD